MVKMKKHYYSGNRYHFTLLHGNLKAVLTKVAYEKYSLYIICHFLNP